MSSEATKREVTRAEMSLLQRMGLRYAVLAAWYEDLRGAGARLGADLPQHLEAARVKISSGCYSSCDVGCDLSAAEGALTSADASAGGRGVGFWLELLARAMDETAGVERLLAVPAVQFHYRGCGFGPCGCSS